jgi:hypothetical protein
MRCHTLSRFTSRLTLTSRRTHVGFRTFLLNFLYSLHNLHIRLHTCGSSKLCSVNRVPRYRSASLSHSWMQHYETRIWQCWTNIFSIPYIINCSIFIITSQHVHFPPSFTFFFIYWLWLTQEYMHNHMLGRSTMLLCIKGSSSVFNQHSLLFPTFSLSVSPAMTQLSSRSLCQWPCTLHFPP